ncbi:MAG: hypothetical protein N2327_01575 [Caldimicrobium sp.]|nr:hypothetical protein [Caldimicrobium sp.]MCX7873108.1 hypothetical protein [Caldimicrobium sp.]MDW8094862.1 hypothetical protein [Caldimicrobium sp.]
MKRVLLKGLVLLGLLACLTVNGWAKGSGGIGGAGMGQGENKGQTMKGQSFRYGAPAEAFSQDQYRL